MKDERIHRLRRLAQIKPKRSTDYADYAEIKDKRTYKIIGCAMEVQSTDYADYADLTSKMRDEKTYKIIGCAMEVHKELGRGFLEAIYQEALGREFATQGIPYKPQPVVEIKYKGQPLNKTYQPDFVCYEEVVVEIKAMSSLTGLEEAQLINYLKTTGLKVGLLINFGNKSLEHKRLVYGF